MSDVSADLTASAITQPTGTSAASGAHGVAETMSATIQSLIAADNGLSTLDALIQAAEASLATKTSTIVESGGSGGLGSTGGTYAARPAGVTGAVLYVGADNPTTSSAANNGAPALATDVWLAYGGSGGSSGLTAILPWAANTAYTVNQLALSPSGALIQATTSFTSGSSYNAANWTVLGAATTAVAAIQAQVSAAQTRASAAPYLIFYGPSSWPARPSTTAVPAGQAEYVSLTAGVAAPTDSQPGDRLLIATVSTSGVLPSVASGTLIADWNVGAQGLANGASVPTLVDASGHGHTLTSAGSAEATIIASWQNGKAGASFAGTAYYQVHSDATLVPTTGGFTVFVVFSETTAAPLPASSYSALFSTKYGGGNSGLSLDAWNTYDESTAGPQLVDDSTGATNTLYLDGSTTAVTYTVGTPHVATLVSTAVPTSNSGYFAVGENTTGSGGPFTGVIGRVVAYTGALNNTDRAAVEAALAAEFGFTG
jgi:hypothetical protein